jgi:serine/threonine protein kinase/Tfp pilus assembly protein PilF
LPAFANTFQVGNPPRLLRYSSRKHSGELMPLSVGDCLARYEIRGFLGAGGMGEVYRAHDQRLDRDVAIKVLPEGLSQEPDRLSRFEREARAAAALNHPNILDVHDLGEHEGRVFIVTELLEGESLRAVIATGNLTLRKAVEYGRQIATGLAAAHDNGITHRDLKPANLFLTDEGLIKILDFGLAKLTRPDTSPAELSKSPTLSFQTESGIALGTPGYIAPEQLHGRPADQRSDVFSLGVVLYEMVTGQHPFPGATIAEIHAAILTEGAPSLDRVSPDVPPLLEHLVARCLEKRPEDRFQSARDLLFALEELSTGEVTTKRRRVHSPWFRRASFATVAIATAIIAAVFFQRSSHGVPFQERDWLLITDFENLTGDATFDRALNPALTVAIEQSSYVNVLSKDSMQPVLRQMKREDATEIDEALGREIARRRGIDVILVPSISQLGNRYALTASLKNPATGDTYVSQLEYSEGVDDLLPALDRLCRNVRGDLGEAFASIEQRSQPLAAATTSSLEALERLSLATECLHRSDARGASRHFEVALRLDPDFTLAKVGLGILHLDWSHVWPETDPATGKRLFEEALTEVDSLTELERLQILAMHASLVKPDSERAIEEYRSLLAVYPDQHQAHNNLARIFERTGRYEEATIEYKKAIEGDPNLVLAYNGLVFLFSRRGEVNQVIEWATREIEIDETQVWPHVNLCIAYLAKDDVERAHAAALRAVEIRPEITDSHFMLGHALKYGGHFADAARSYEKVIEIEPRNPWGYYHAGIVLQYAGESDKAREHLAVFKRAIEKRVTDEPDEITHHILLDVARNRLGEEPLTSYTKEQLASTDPDINFGLAQLASLQGRTEDALAHLETALDAGLGYLTWIMVQPDFDPIRDDPRFQDLKRHTLKLETS